MNDGGGQRQLLLMRANSRDEFWAGRELHETQVVSAARLAASGDRGHTSARETEELRAGEAAK